MLRIKMLSQGEDLASFSSRMTKENWFELQEDLYNLGQETHKFMQQTIVNNIKRPGSTGNLVRNIEFHFFSAGYTCGFWIGDIDNLNTNAPYWRWLNYGVAGTGRRIPPGSNEGAIGHFAPGIPEPTQGDFRGGRWQQAKRSPTLGLFRIYPKKPIEAINYIESSIFILETSLSKLLIRTK